MKNTRIGSKRQGRKDQEGVVLTVSALAAVRQKVFHWRESPVVTELAGVAGCFLAGLLFSRAQVLEKYAPFGVAAAAAAPYHYLWAAAAGALMGYLLPSSLLVPVRYLACVLAAAAIRWTLHDLHRISRNQFTLSLIHI